ncbi:hypothetical protein OPIT5_06925 [Opitutaceae bacterium TAV5]|nr:hypothetical protein OPIT5_06925 [Opitutaceae bacterium TAV5]
MTCSESSGIRVPVFAILVACLPFAAFSSRPLVAQDKPSPDARQERLVVAETTGINPLDGPFIGFGAQWDSTAYIRNGITDADFDLIEKRLGWMRTPIVRMMMVSGWCYQGNGRYDWDSPQMRMVLRQLDVCQKLGISVILTEWGYNTRWMRTPEVSDIGDPKHVEIIGSYMEYLVKTKGYSCIRYFGYVNEPSSSYAQKQDLWLQGIDGIAAEFRRRDLADKVRLVGPDSASLALAMFDRKSWLAPLQKRAASVGAYQFHTYIVLEDMRRGGLKDLYSEAWRQVREGDPDKTKPLIIGEAGIWKWGPTRETKTGADNNAWNREDPWAYGIYMAEYAIQAIEAGSWGVLAWMLDDNSHYGFNWGMWTSKKDGMQLRPWFYTWSLLSRSFPPGSEFSKVYPPPVYSNMRILAAKLPVRTGDAKQAGAGREWAFLIVNTGTSHSRIRVRVPGGHVQKSDVYSWSRNAASADADGFPRPSTTLESSLDEGFPMSFPPQSVTIVVPQGRDERI